MRAGVEGIRGSFTLEGLARKFTAGIGNNIPIYIKTTDSNENFYQLTLNNSGGDLGKQKEGKWTTLWEIATKSDLIKKEIVRVSGTTDEYSNIAVNTQNNFTNGKCFAVSNLNEQLYNPWNVSVSGVDGKTVLLRIRKMGDNTGVPNTALPNFNVLLIGE